MTKEKRDRIRELASKATRGIWEYCQVSMGDYFGPAKYGLNIGWEYGEAYGGREVLKAPEYFSVQLPENGEFIAAANPADIIKLLDSLDQFEKREKILIEALKQADKLYADDASRTRVIREALKQVGEIK